MRQYVNVIGVAAAAAVMAACATSPVVTTASTPIPATTSTAGGEVTLNTPTGMWIDSVGGTWIDTTGGVFMGGPRGLPVGLQQSDIGTLNDANIIAHIQLIDSLEVELSRIGAKHARNEAVEDFADRMVRDHGANSVVAGQTAAKAEFAPITAAADTADFSLAGRMLARLNSTPAGASYDQQLMRDEVALHRHALYELQLLRSQATGPTRDMIEATIPAVRKHLASALTLLHQIGGDVGNSMR